MAESNTESTEDAMDVEKNSKQVLQNGSATEDGTRHPMKKDDSGISVEKSENSSDDDGTKKLVSEDGDGPSASGVSSATRQSTRFRNRPYRKKQDGDDEDEQENETQESAAGCSWVFDTNLGAVQGSPDSGHNEVDIAEVVDRVRDYSMLNFLKNRTRSSLKRSRDEDDQESDSDDDEDAADADADDDTVDRNATTEDEESCNDEVARRVLSKSPPKHKWFITQEIVNRQQGCSNNLQSDDMFRFRCYGSLHCVQRLELMYKMNNHDGCVNTLHFNSSGTRLASGSDDLHIVVWDWTISKSVLKYDSGHRSNVFQAKFLPFQGDTHIVSCARDGQVRLAELSSTGACHGTTRLAQHKSPANKLALHVEMPHVFLSVAEDGMVFSIDVREGKGTKLLAVRETDRRVPLYSIHSHPLNMNEFCVGGRDQFVRIYDKRRIDSTGFAMKKFCPHHLLNTKIPTNVTSTVYNYDGTEILGSYNDEDIYLFDATHSDGADFIKKYSGHRNSATVKSVNFFGPKSEFVVSGSDCRNIFFWEKETGAIVQCMPGDENGVVNCLEPHPTVPVLATSGLDDDIKIWVPSCEQPPALKELESTVINNFKQRERDRMKDPDTFDSQMLWILWRHIRRTERRRRMATTQNGENCEENSSESSDDSDSDDDSDDSHRVQCPTS